MAVPLRRRLLVIGVLALAMGCGGGGFGEAYRSRVCWAGTTPGQCDHALLDLRCRDPAVARVAAADVERGVIGTRVRTGEASAQIGQLFSQWCPPDCIPIFASGGSPAQTLQRDVRQILRRSGYRLVSDPDGTSPVLLLDLGVLDVRSDDPGWFSMRIATRATASFTTSLAAPSGEIVWSESFSGSQEIRHAYAALSDYQSALDGAYCEALAGFAAAIAGGALELEAGARLESPSPAARAPGIP